MPKPPATRFLISLYHTPGAASREVFYSVTRAGHLVAGPEHHITRDHYPGHELIFCRAGKGFVKIAGRSHAVGAGQLVWVNCYHPHAYWAEPESPWELYWIRVEGLRLDAIYQMLALEREPVISKIVVRAVEKCFHAIFDALQSRQPDASAWVHAEMARLIALIFQARQSANGTGASKPEIPAFLQRPIERMRLYYHQPMRVAELASLAGMSQSHFIRQFRLVMGTTPIDWLRRERITHAKQRLIESGDTVKEIARQCGYADQFFFSKDFKRLTGFTPTDFRRRERGESKPAGG